MKFNLKTIGIALGALVGVAVIAVALFFVFFPKQLAAQQAERLIEESTGRDLTLGDNIEVSFWPALGFSIDQATLSNPEGFSADEPFMAAERIVFAVKVLPLLRGAIEVKELILEGADLRLAAKQDGAANWAFPTEQTQPDQQTTIEDLRLDDVRLVDSRISFQGADGEPLVLEDVDASLRLDSLDAPAALDAAFDYRGQRVETESTISLPRAVLEKGETPLAANIRAAPIAATFDGAFNAATGALAGRLDANGSSLRQLAAWMGSPMGDGGGFGAFRVSSQMAHEGQTTTLNDLSLRLDDIDARGNLTLVTQESGRLRVGGALSAPSVDINTYLPAPSQGQAEGGVETDAAWPTTPLDLSGLRALDANLNLSLGALQFQRMSFSDVALNLRVANGAADARLSRVSLYEGAGTARMIADGSGRTPRIAVEIDAQNVQAETLLRDAIGFDKIVGRGRLTASFVGTGASQAAIMRSLAGNANFLFNDGQWKGVNLAQVARSVQSTLTGQAAGEGAATDFAELGATFAISNGQMATDNLRLLNPFVRLEGRGLIDIGAQAIDMRIAPRAVRSAQGQGGDLGVAGLGVPFRVSGPWTRVRFAPALEDVVQSQVRDILGRQEAGSPLSRLGEALFGRAPAEATTAAETPTEGATPPATTASETATPTPPPAEERPRNPLEDILRRATRSREPTPPPPAEPAPTPTP
jgi:AsmA protein